MPPFTYQYYFSTFQHVKLMDHTLLSERLTQNTILGIQFLHLYLKKCRAYLCIQPLIRSIQAYSISPNWVPSPDRHMTSTCSETRAEFFLKILLSRHLNLTWLSGRAELLRNDKIFWVLLP